MDIDALIPARGGSKRIPGKNMKLLNGMPLVYWTIKAANDAGIFKRVVVSTEDAEIKAFCQQYCDVHDRPVEYAKDTSPDYEWLYHYFQTTENSDFFSLLRPTNPFRTVDTIRQVVADFFNVRRVVSSMRSVTLIKQHPQKMWLNRGPYIEQYERGYEDEYMAQKSFELPTQLLQKGIFVQNGCIEISKKKNILERSCVAGDIDYIYPFFMTGPEAHDLNTPEDWVIAEWYLKEGMVTL